MPNMDSGHPKMVITTLCARVVDIVIFFLFFFLFSFRWKRVCLFRNTKYWVANFHLWYNIMAWQWHFFSISWFVMLEMAHALLHTLMYHQFQFEKWHYCSVLNLDKKGKRAYFLCLPFFMVVIMHDDVYFILRSCAHSKHTHTHMHTLTSNGG